MTNKLEKGTLDRFCPQCKKIKQPFYFYSSNQTSDGLSTYCKECMHIRQKNYRKSPHGKAKRAEQYKRWYEKNYGIRMKDKRIYDDKKEYFTKEEVKAIIDDAYTYGLITYDGVKWNDDSAKAIEQSDKIDDKMLKELYAKHKLEKVN